MYCFNTDWSLFSRKVFRLNALRECSLSSKQRFLPLWYFNMYLTILEKAALKWPTKSCKAFSVKNLAAEKFKGGKKKTNRTDWIMRGLDNRWSLVMTQFDDMWTAVRQMTVEATSHRDFDSGSLGIVARGPGNEIYPQPGTEARFIFNWIE